MKVIKIFGYKIVVYTKDEVNAKKSKQKHVHGHSKVRTCNRCSNPATHGNYCYGHWVDYSFGY